MLKTSCWMIITSKNGSYKWILNKLLCFYLNNILLYENYLNADIKIRMQTKKKSYCKVCLCAERGCGHICALVMHLKTTWWKILIRTYCHCNQKSHKTKTEKEKRNTACSLSRGLNKFISLLLNSNFILFCKNLNFNISNLLHGEFCHLLF